MTQTAIPAEFEAYLQEKINDGGVPDMNQMIFAYIPGLDTETAIDRGLGLPDAQYRVHTQDIDQSGKLGDNALVYSVVIPSAVPAFTFNAIYLHDKNVANSCGMVVYKADETKEDGMASTKSLVQQYSGAALMAEITVDAATWQIDYHARLFGIEEDHRLSCLDSYGHTAFIDGFDVTQGADPTKYTITPGLCYIGGLRATLDAENIQTIINKPNAIYIDVHREGTALSQWDNVLTIPCQNQQWDDYTDGQGKQHYVAKLATINADGSISDLRTEQTGELERADNAATNDDIDAESTASKHVKLEQFWRGVDNKLDAATGAMQDQLVSVSLYEGVLLSAETAELSENLNNFLFIAVVIGDGAQDLDIRTIPASCITSTQQFTSLIADTSEGTRYGYQETQFSFQDGTHITNLLTYDLEELQPDGSSSHAIRRVIGVLRVAG